MDASAAPVICSWKSGRNIAKRGNALNIHIEDCALIKCKLN